MKEISTKRLEANRLNALKSTGPTSPDGKHKVSKNATKHGIFAKSLLVEGESPKHLKALINAIYEEFDPRTPVECLYVDKIAAMQWRCTRLWAAQSANLSDEIRRQPEDISDLDPATRLAYATRTLLEKGRSQDALSLYEHRFERQQHLAFEALERLQQRRKAAEILPGINKATSRVENKEETPAQDE